MRLLSNAKQARTNAYLNARGVSPLMPDCQRRYPP